MKKSAPIPVRHLGRTEGSEYGCIIGRIDKDTVMFIGAEGDGGIVSIEDLEPIMASDHPIRPERSRDILEDLLNASFPQKPLPTYASIIEAQGADGLEFHIECRWADGQKYAPIVVDAEHPELADFIARCINNRT